MSTQIKYFNKVKDALDTYEGKLRVEIDVSSKEDLTPEDCKTIIDAINSIKEALAGYPSEEN